MGFYIGKGLLLSFAAYLTQSQRSLPERGFAPHRALLSFAFRDTARRVSLSQIVCARGEFTAAAAQRVIRGASRAEPYIEAQRGKCPPAAIWLYSHLIIGRARHKLARARQLRRIYRASVRASYTPGEQRFPARGGIRHCRTVPNSAFRISNQRWRGLRRPLP